MTRSLVDHQFGPGRWRLPCGRLILCPEEQLPMILQLGCYRSRNIYPTVVFQPSSGHILCCRGLVYPVLLVLVLLHPTAVWVVVLRMGSRSLFLYANAKLLQCIGSPFAHTPYVARLIRVLKRLYGRLTNTDQCFDSTLLSRFPLKRFDERIYSRSTNFSQGLNCLRTHFFAVVA